MQLNMMIKHLPSHFYSTIQMSNSYNRRTTSNHSLLISCKSPNYKFIIIASFIFSTVNLDRASWNLVTNFFFNSSLTDFLASLFIDIIKFSKLFPPKTMLFKAASHSFSISCCVFLILLL